MMLKLVCNPINSIEQEMAQEGNLFVTIGSPDDWLGEGIEKFDGTNHRYILNLCEIDSFGKSLHVISQDHGRYGEVGEICDCIPKLVSHNSPVELEDINGVYVVDTTRNNIFKDDNFVLMFNGR